MTTAHEALLDYLDQLLVAAERPTLLHLANKSGLSQATLSGLTRGWTAKPKWDVVRRYVEALDGDVAHARQLWNATVGRHGAAELGENLGGGRRSGPLPELLAGVYRHYKGHLYLVLGYGRDANVEGRQVVVYVGLQLDGAGAGPRMSVRAVEDFFAAVDPRTGVLAADGTAGAVARFSYVGPDLRPGPGSQEIPRAKIERRSLGIEETNPAGDDSGP